MSIVDRGIAAIDPDANPRGSVFDTALLFLTPLPPGLTFSGHR